MAEGRVDPGAHAWLRGRRSCSSSHSSKQQASARRQLGVSRSPRVSLLGFRVVGARLKPQPSPLLLLAAAPTPAPPPCVSPNCTLDPPIESPTRPTAATDAASCRLCSCRCAYRRYCRRRCHCLCYGLYCHRCSTIERPTRAGSDLVHGGGSPSIFRGSRRQLLWRAVLQLLPLASVPGCTHAHACTRASRRAGCRTGSTVACWNGAHAGTGGGRGG